MTKDILLSSYQKLLDSPKLIKLTLITSITHSLIFVIAAVYNTYFFLENKFDLNTSSQVIKYILGLFKIDGILRKMIIVLVIIGLGYFVLSPVGDGMVISHLGGKNSIRSNLKDGIKYYYRIVEYDSIVMIFNFTIFFSLFSKLFVYNIANPVLIGIMGIWFFAILFVFMMLQYVKYVIVFEGLKVGEAITRSINYSIDNIGLTVRLMITNIIVNLRLILNLLFIIGLPILVIYILHLAGWLGSLNQNIIYILFIVTVAFLAYINSIIDAYFKIYRYQAYMKVSGKDLHVGDDNSKDSKNDLYKDNLFDMGSTRYKYKSTS